MREAPGRTATAGSVRATAPEASVATSCHQTLEPAEMPSAAKVKVTLDPKDSTALFEPIEYAWHDRVFVCGSILDRNGAEHRWKNDEVAPLLHMGDGLYKGTVRFFEDYVYPGYATFLIMASRSTLEEDSTALRPGWLEASYASSENDCYLTPGELAEDLVRGYGNSHRFRIEWTPGDDYKDYVVSFNMNNSTLVVKADDGSDDDAIDVIMPSHHRVVSVFDLSGRRIDGNSKLPGINIIRMSDGTAKKVLRK